MNVFRKIAGTAYYLWLYLTSRKYPESRTDIDVNGVRLACFMRGPADGRPVVLLHGNDSSHRSMRTQAMELAKKGYRAISPDSRGQGVNTPLEEYHYADMAEDTFQLIRTLGLEKPAVFGWSDGGIIALLLEMAHPGTCGPCVVSGANLHPDCGPDFEAFKEWILSQGTPIVMMMLREPDIKPAELAAVKCPVLVTSGEKDLISVEHTEMIAGSIPDSELEIFKGESHGSYIKKSPKLGRRMLRFLSERGYLPIK